MAVAGEDVDLGVGGLGGCGEFRLQAGRLLVKSTSPTQLLRRKDQV